MTEPFDIQIAAGGFRVYWEPRTLRAFRWALEHADLLVIAPPYTELGDMTHGDDEGVMRIDALLGQAFEDGLLVGNGDTPVTPDPLCPRCGRAP